MEMLKKEPLDALIYVRRGEVEVQGHFVYWYWCPDSYINKMYNSHFESKCKV